ncbi:MAG TPA: hypothetical protein VHL59_11520 [Thermoanaerobaculia bacterium]|nr:hypothetical protein [Thermoanaerobaculia bacterium]
MRPPTYEWILDHPAFDRLLEWLDPDPDTASRKYEEIRRNLLKFFIRRGCVTPEEQVDRVMDRVARRLTEGIEIYAVNPYHYFVGVARNVFREYLRQRRRTPELAAAAPEDAAWSHLRLSCMERCWAMVPPNTREMMIDYCMVAKASKKRQREALAARLGLSLSNLRIRVHRVRQHLERSVAVCLSRSDAGG